MKALSTTILIVVTAVVILVAALVLLTIFGGGVGTVGTLTSFRTQCATQCSITCKLGGVPPTWNVPSKIQGESQPSCHDFFTSDCASAECGGTSNTNPGTGGCPAGTEPCAKQNGACLSRTDCLGLR